MLEKDISAIVATDGSDYSLKAARKASVMLKNGVLKKVTVIYVVETEKDMNRLTSLKETLEEEGKEILGRTLAVMPYQQGVKHEILFGDPAAKICEYARKNQMDVIIMGAKGRSEVMDLLIGSVCNKIVHYAPCSVLLMRISEWD